MLQRTGTGLQCAYTRVELKNKKLTDIAALSTYVHLRYVDFSQNHVSDMSPLASIPELLSIEASSNRLEKAALPTMKYLQRANLSKNKITSAEGISHPLLEKLNLAHNQLADVSALKSSTLPSLLHLDLTGNLLASPASVQIASLTHLYLGGNRITSLAGMDALVNLEALHLRGNALESLESMDKPLPKLAYLNLRQNKVKDVKDLARAAIHPVLRILVLAENPVAEEGTYRLEALVAIPQLQRLDKSRFEDDERAEAREIAKSRKD